MSEIEQIENRIQSLSVEDMVLFAGKYFLECMDVLGQRFGFLSVIQTSKESLTTVTEAIHRAIHDLEAGLSPRDWLDGRRGM